VRASFREGGSRARADGHVGAFAGQFFRNRPAKPFADGRDDGYSACEP